MLENKIGGRWNVVERTPIGENEVPSLGMVGGIILHSLRWSVLSLATFLVVYAFLGRASMSDSANNDNDKQKRRRSNDKDTSELTATLSDGRKRRQSYRALITTAVLVISHALFASISCAYIACKTHWRVQEGHFDNLTHRRWAIFPFLQYDVPLVSEDSWILEVSVGYFIFDTLSSAILDPTILYFLHHLGYFFCGIPALIWDRAWMYLIYATLLGEMTNPLQHFFEHSRNEGMKSLEARLGPPFVVAYTICRFLLCPLVILDTVLFVVENVYWNRQGQWTLLHWVRLWSCLICGLGLVGSLLWFQPHARQYLYPMFRQQTTPLKKKTL